MVEKCVGRWVSLSAQSCPLLGRERIAPCQALSPFQKWVFFGLQLACIPRGMGHGGPTLSLSLSG